MSVLTLTEFLEQEIIKKQENTLEEVLIDYKFNLDITRSEEYNPLD